MTTCAAEIKLADYGYVPCLLVVGHDGPHKTSSPRDSRHITWTNRPLLRDGVMRLVEADVCTYRQIDYWIRTGKVWLTNDASNSGTYRRVTDAEAAGIAAVAEAYALRQQILDGINDGSIFRDARNSASTEVA